jgi:hypothetical protein
MHTVYRGSRLKTAKASGDATASRTEPVVSFASKSNRAGPQRNYASEARHDLSAGEAAAGVTFARSETVTEASHPEGSSNFEFSPGLAEGPRTMSYERTRMTGNQQAPPMMPDLQNTPLVAPAGQDTGPRSHRTTSYERMIGNQRAPPMTPAVAPHAAWTKQRPPDTTV